MQFTVPGTAARAQALGSLEYLPPAVRRALDPSTFDPIHAPGPADWLSVHPENGQGYADFLHSHPHYPDQTHSTIYLQPLDVFPADAPSLTALKSFTEALVSMRVNVLPVMHLPAGKITTRVDRETGKRQMLTTDVRKALAQHMPRDAYCVLGLTMRDLYPDPAWNFVFGEASLTDRVGVYSFARYDPRFYGSDSPNRAELMLRRSCKVLAHETGHMFGMAHCIYFRCVMNGSNSMDETDASPLHLCPVDLRKLYASNNLNLIERYAHLAHFYRSVDFNDEATWTEKRLQHAAALPAK